MIQDLEHILNFHIETESERLNHCAEQRIEKPDLEEYFRMTAAEHMAELGYWIFIQDKIA